MFVVKTLYADGEPIDPRLAIAFKMTAVGGTGIRFESDFYIAAKTNKMFCGIQYFPNRLC